MLQLSKRVRRIRLSPNAAAGQRAKDLAAQGRDILVLTSGEPDFDTPAPVRAAGIAAIEGGQTRYTAMPGIAPLRQAIAAQLARAQGLDVTPAQVVVSNGAKQVLYQALAATLDPGDEAIVPAPYWPAFIDMVLLCDAKPVIVATTPASGFKLTAAQLAAALTPRTRVLILNSPGNPSGAVYGEADWLALAEVLRAHPQVVVVLDEIYEHIRFDDAPARHLLVLAPDLAPRTVLVNGASKTYAMTGWRVGWGIAPLPLAQAMTALQSQVSSAPSAISQAAALAAIEGDQGFVREAAAAYHRRRDIVVDGLARVPGLQLLPPQGAFFAFVHVGGLIGRRSAGGRVLRTDADVTDWLLDEAGVAVVDGASFGLSPYIRLSTAAADEVLHDAVRRIAEAVAALPEGRHG